MNTLIFAFMFGILIKAKLKKTSLYNDVVLTVHILVPNICMNSYNEKSPLLFSYIQALTKMLYVYIYIYILYINDSKETFKLRSIQLKIDLRSIKVCFKKVFTFV